MFSVLKRAAALWLALAPLAMAQTSPNFGQNTVLSSTALNAAFAGKVDTLNGTLTTPIVNNPTINSATMSGTIAGNPSFTGTLSLNAVQSFTATGLITANGTGGWSSFNIGKQLYITTPTNSSNPGIGISDSTGSNPMAIYNATGGILTVASMPALSDGDTPATVIGQFSSSGLEITGNISASGNYISGATTGVTCSPGSPTASFAVVGGIVTHC